jgi:hypothetical protein
MHLLELRPPTTVESYLNNNKDKAFPTVDSDDEKLDGCYLTLDNVRRNLIRSGFAELGLGRRWKEHRRASHLNDRNTRDRPQHQIYPHESVGDDESPSRTGTMSQLQRKMAMGMRKCDARGRELTIVIVFFHITTIVGESSQKLNKIGKTFSSRCGVYLAISRNDKKVFNKSEEKDKKIPLCGKRQKYLTISFMGWEGMCSIYSHS